MAYASFASLMRTMESVLTSNSLMQSLREEFRALHDKVSSLEVYLKNFEKGNVSEEMTDLEIQIKEVANAIEHTIQLRLTEYAMADDEMQKQMADERLYDSLKQVAEEIDRVQKELPKIQNEGKQASKESLVQDLSSGKHTPNVENNMVGRDDQRKKLLEDLTKGFNSEPKVIPIVGMGGIGKTTLARDVYNDASIRLHFDVCAWATISQQHNVKEILLSLVHSAKGVSFYMDGEAELADMLQKSLKGRRYLIVLDDMWKSEAWDDIRLCFPIQNNGSRILLTTRNAEVACSAGTENLSLKMDFLNPDESWNLFKSAALTNEALSYEFESIGKQIVYKCQGLPLTIVTVAGLLSKCKRTIKVWGNVAKDVKSFVTNDPDKRCLHVLWLSYNHLTSDQKSCLLYFGNFPEDSEISATRLLRFWMAEGFLKLDKDSEGEAERCLQDLIDRCLVLVSKKSLDETKIRTCKVHDLIHELCLREAKSQNVFVLNDFVFDDSDAEKADIVLDDELYSVAPECHHISRHKIRPFKRWTDGDDIDYGSFRALLTREHHHLIRRHTDDVDNNLLKRTRSIFNLTSSKRTRSIFHLTSSLVNCTLGSEFIQFSLLRILDLSLIELRSFPPQILCLIWLRYLILSSRGGGFDIPSDICTLWNLQLFIVEQDGSRREFFPQQIWELSQLRHLRLCNFYLPNPLSVSVDEESYLTFSNVHTISGLSPTSCTKEVISGIRNIKKLGFFGGKRDYERVQEYRLLDNLVHLHQLETLSFVVKNEWISGQIARVTIPSAQVFPATLKTLKLVKTRLRWKDLDIIGELPNLEVLKLKLYACRGEKWCPIAGGFNQLKLLIIERNNFKHWEATDDTFIALERLVIRDCRKLQQIPIEFAEISTLQLIELQGCKPKLNTSAAEIQQEQEDIGNEPVHVRILQSYSSEYNIT
ncbi:PREDICTED: putative late blight resistance protein homolog R1A-10 [Nicotiana attenuata]|uniref:putative late blight resistance protein homolog R1A-10 n=1 Tax=Nicotiana attenuata TaxID=49451 RepID=UPI000904A93F|nr:PREDICTED: putative late blight resistance protein homolog R1A-10 [Nicotiana attenuata]